MQVRAYGSGRESSNSAGATYVEVGVVECLYFWISGGGYLCILWGRNGME